MLDAIKLVTFRIKLNSAAWNSFAIVRYDAVKPVLLNAATFMAMTARSLLSFLAGGPATGASET